jgi:hypothetical protein
MLTRFLAVACVVLVSPAVFSGETKITKLTKTPLVNGDLKVDIEGTNELFNGEVLGSWTSNFTHPNGNTLASTILVNNPPIPGAGPKTFKFSITIASPVANGGVWYANSILQCMIPMVKSTVKYPFAVP